MDGRYAALTAVDPDLRCYGPLRLLQSRRSAGMTDLSWTMRTGDALLLSDDRDLMAFLLGARPGQQVPQVTAAPVLPTTSPPSSPAA